MKSLHKRLLETDDLQESEDKDNLKFTLRTQLADLKQDRAVKKRKYMIREEKHKVKSIEREKVAKGKKPYFLKATSTRASKQKY